MSERSFAWLPGGPSGRSAKRRSGRKGFELAIEAAIPGERRKLIPNLDFDTVRYEVGIGVDPAMQERWAIDVMEGRPRSEKLDALPGYADLAGEYQKHGDSMVTPAEATARLAEMGRKGPAAALDNGLDDAENRELFLTTDSHRMVELILTGMRRRFPSSG